MTSDEKKLIRGALQEMTDSMTRVAAERDLMKDIVRRIKDETTVAPKVFRKMARAAFASNFHEEVQTNEEFEELYVEVTGIGDDD